MVDSVKSKNAIRSPRTRLNLLGKQFGYWTVLCEHGRVKCRNRQIYWKCQCRCGTIKLVGSSTLKSGQSKSCGCYQKEVASTLFKSNKYRFKQLYGKVFGRLQPIFCMGFGKKGAKWLCLCECGNRIITKAIHLTSGKCKSCGCLSIKNASKYAHYLFDYPQGPGHKKSEKLYKRWIEYNRIGTCDEWAHSFQIFQDWALSCGWKEGDKIIRIDKKMPFSPENCFIKEC